MNNEKTMTDQAQQTVPLPTTGFQKAITGGSLTLLLLVGTAAVPVTAEPPPLWPDNPWSTASQAPGYAPASAHAPRYEDKVVWPRLTGKEPFLKETWTAGRVLVWAHPGKNAARGAKAKQGLVADDPANWLENGKPATRLFDEQTDVVFPDSDTPYFINLVGCSPQVFRHLTIGKGAHYHGGGDAIGRRHYGNTWIKRGGQLSCGGGCNFLGNRHQWYRNDNQKADITDRKSNAINTAQYFFFNKEGQGSVEFLGLHGCGDEFKVWNSLVVVGVDSCVRPGRNASPFAEGGGTIAVLDGGVWGPWANTWSAPTLRLTDGTLSGGLPDRPMTRGATVNLSFKNSGNAQYSGPGGQREKGEQVQYKRVPSLLLQGKSRVLVYSSDPARAYLSLIEAGDLPSNVLAANKQQRAEQRQKDPQAAPFFNWYDSLPRGIDVLIMGESSIGPGVLLDRLRPGGIVLGPGAERSRVQANFGPNCQAKGDALFSTIAEVKKGGKY